MELPEQAVTRSFSGPFGSLLVLAVSVYFAAVLHPIMRGSRIFDWDVFPPFDAFFGGASLLYIPVMMLCLACSALDRSDGSRISFLGGYSTFCYYVVWDFAKGEVAFQIALFMIAMLPIPIFLFRDKWSEFRS